MIDHLNTYATARPTTRHTSARHPLLPAQINIQTAGQGSQGAEVQAAFLRDPEAAQRALRLAVKLAQAGPSDAPAPAQGMSRGSPSGQGLRQRLQRLDLLLAQQLLTGDEVARVRLAVLQAEEDLTLKLVGASELLRDGLISQLDFAQLKAGWLARATDGL
jgi:hypothetical protein